MTERYQTIDLLEKDQLGSVYLAQDTTLQRRVVYRDFEQVEGKERPEEFSQYTGKLCALQHPNLLTIYDIAKNEDGYYMVTQFIEGESLADRLAQGALNQVGVHNMAVDLLDALHAAHSSGLFHGALRTDSVKRLARVRGGHRYLIVDFGLDRISAMICGTHVIMADPVLMAPELGDGKSQPDGQSDLFTLGQLCYIALVGGHPYAGKTHEECAQAYQDGGLPHLSTYVQGVQQDFADWVMWLVAGPKDQRPASSKEAMEALHAITLKAPAPNVPGVTQAVDVPEQPDPMQPKISEPVTVSAESSKKSKKKAKKPKKALGASKPMNKEGKMLLAAVGVVIVLLLVLILILIFRPDEPEEADLGRGKADPTLVQLQPTHLIGELLTKSKPVKIQFDGSNTLDWTVVTGIPASSARMLKDGGSYIRNILAIGEFSEFIRSETSVIYQAGGTTITPQRAVMGSKVGGAKEGEGWRVDLRIPEGHSGSLLVTLYMIQNHCDLALEIRATHKDLEDQVDRYQVDKRSLGVVKIPLKIDEPKPGYYSIQILAKGVEVSQDFEMGLSAVLLERV
ncbi:protein kinase [Verrucomicrobiaceae bacterium N1E253]|uniref:Protein kinase n=1 Tax=Oceaniferula marina TaxID=2748318 RepID=A0A851GGU0_9BACT|nr:protein kinase [Oceaniferula marina]NWK56409.1 protein kinase [Oceaniferula marina]